MIGLNEQIRIKYIGMGEIAPIFGPNPHADTKQPAQQQVHKNNTISWNGKAVARRRWVIQGKSAKHYKYDK